MAPRTDGRRGTGLRAAVRAAVLLATLSLLLVSLSGCAGNSAQNPANNPLTEGNPNGVHQPLRFAVLSDPHIKFDPGFGLGGYSAIPAARLSRIGPLLSPRTTSNPRGVIGRLDFVLCTGDNLGDLYGYFDSNNPTVPQQSIANALANYTQILIDTFDGSTPYYIALGNHDDRQYQFNGTSKDNGRFKYYRVLASRYWFSRVSHDGYPITLPKPAPASSTSPSKIVTSDLSNTPDLFCYSWQQNGWLLATLNSGAEKKLNADGTETDIYDGEKADESHRYHDQAHFGAAQVAWLKTTLQGSPDAPVILFWHSLDEGFASATDTNSVAFRRLISDNKGRIKAIFVGHTHAFAQGTFPGTSIPVYTACSATAQTNYQMNADNTVYRDSKRHLKVLGYSEPSYDPYYLVTADADAATVTIDNRRDIFKFGVNGVNRSSAADNHPPIGAAIPGDGSNPSK